MFREMTKTHDVEMSNDFILQSAPSVFAHTPRDDVSDRYGFIPTIQVVDALRDEGWMPVDAAQKNVRKKENLTFTKHLVRFRRLNDDIMLGDSAVELLLTNSHDRSSGFILHAGMFRMACANGIVIADSTFQKVSIRHSQNAPGQVIDASHEVIDDVPMIAESVGEMRNIELTQKERGIFAGTAYDYAYSDDDFLPDGSPRVLTEKRNIVEQLLKPMRFGDVGTDLWITFNVLQEKILRGGIRTVRRSGRGAVRAHTSRKVHSIDRDIKLNKALWEMADQIRAAHMVAA